MPSYRDSTPAAAIIIPARQASTRLPGKLLLAGTGRPLIAHAIAAAQRCTEADGVYVATDSDQIEQAVLDLPSPPQVIRTAIYHRNGTSRCVEAANRIVERAMLEQRHPPDVIVNWQADEPDVHPEDVARLIRFVRHSDVGIATLVRRMDAGSCDGDEGDLKSKHVVKVAVGQQSSGGECEDCGGGMGDDDDGDAHLGRIWYFSRAPLAGAMIHVGVYAFDSGVLTAGVPRMRPSELASCERLEQLQWLEAGVHIHAIEAMHGSRGVNTQADYDQFVKQYS